MAQNPEFDAFLTWLRNSSEANNPHHAQDADRLKDTYPKMMHAIAAYLDALRDHPDTSACFGIGILARIADSAPHDHDQRPSAPAPATDVQPQGEVLPQEDQDAIIAAFIKGLDALPTAGEDNAEKMASRFYPAEGFYNGNKVVVVIDRSTGLGYPFAMAQDAQYAIDVLAAGDVEVEDLYGAPAADFGIAL